jgi:hypothetical protein
MNKWSCLTLKLAKKNRAFEQVALCKAWYFPARVGNAIFIGAQWTG